MTSFNFADMDDIAIYCKNLNTYDNIMNEVQITNAGRAWVCMVFTTGVLKNKPIMIFGVVKYWTLLYGITKY